MRRARTILFGALAAALLVAHAIVAWNSLVTNRLWEDEAFNLTVPLNLLQGLGYSSDGALSGSMITPFDPRISTGPAVLLPVAAVLTTGIDPVIGARLIPLLYWLLLLAGLAVLGRRIGGRWAGLAAVAVPLAFTAAGSVSPIQGPADLLGEIPAAALIVWALVALRRRPWLAGLILGLAVQAKLIALLALPAFAVALFALASERGWGRAIGTLRRGWLPLILVGVPTLFVELSALIALGPTGFAAHLRALRDFVRSGGQNYEPTTVPQKLQTVFESWFTWEWLAVLAALVAAALVVAGGVVAGGVARKVSPERAALLAAAGIGLLAFVGWWATAENLPLWVRHPAPGIFAFAPILAAGAVWGAGVLLRRGLELRVLAGAGVAVLVVAIGASIGIRTAAEFAPRDFTLQTQRQGVEPLTQWVAETGTEWLAADPWGWAVAPIVMAGAHLGMADAPSMLDAPRVTGGECSTELILDTGAYRLCAAP